MIFQSLRVNLEEHIPAALLVWFLSAGGAESFFLLTDDEDFYPAAQILDINVLYPQKHCTNEQYCTCPGPGFLFYIGWISVEIVVRLIITKQNDFPLLQPGVIVLTSTVFDQQNFLLPTSRNPSARWEFLINFIATVAVSFTLVHFATVPKVPLPKKDSTR